VRDADDDTDFSPDNFSFDFGPEAIEEESANEDIDTSFNPEAEPESLQEGSPAAEVPNEGFATAPTTSDILKFLIDRTGYIKLLEEEDTPEAYSRVENLRELVNAAMDSRDR